MQHKNAHSDCYLYVTTTLLNTAVSVGLDVKLTIFDIPLVAFGQFPGIFPTAVKFPTFPVFQTRVITLNNSIWIDIIFQSFFNCDNNAGNY